MDEIERVWKASDHFDSGALQFVGIICAGALAAAAIIADKHPPPILQPWLLWLIVGLVVLGVVGLMVFIVLAINSTLTGVLFGGPIDPRRLSKEDLDDDELFEKNALPAIKAAFDLSLKGYERKRAIFRRSLRVLLVAMACFGLAGIVTVTVLTSRGGGVMAKDKPGAPPPQTPPTTQPQVPRPQPNSEPTLGPYPITKSKQVPRPSSKGDTIRRKSP